MSRPELTAVHVREATMDDAELLAVLQAEMDDEEVEDRSRAGADMRQTLLDMARYPDFHAYLVRDGGGVAVGSFSLMIFSSPSHGGSKQALLDAVVVSRSRRGQGIGEAMLQHAMRLAKDAGCYKMMLSSNLKRVDAHRFYERLGFSQHGISFSILLS